MLICKNESLIASSEWNPLDHTQFVGGGVVFVSQRHVGCLPAPMQRHYNIFRQICVTLSFSLLSSASWCPACPLLLDVPPVLNSLMFHLSSASWCPACPHLLDVPPVLSFLLSRLSSAFWCPACPLLLDVPSVCCCLMSSLSSGAQCIFKPCLLYINIPCILVSV